MLQYVSSGVFFARVKIDRKLFRQSLKTNVWTTAKLRLVDFLKKHNESRGSLAAPKFTEAVEAYKRDLETNSALKPQSKRYRLWCLQKIERSWPKLWDLRLDQITEEACKEWGAKLNKDIACHYKSLSNWAFNIAVGCSHACRFCYVPSAATIKQGPKLVEYGVKDPDADWGVCFWTY